MARPFAKTQEHILQPFTQREGLQRVNTHCSGPCDQGRKPCQTPEACERAIDCGPSLWQRFKAWFIAPGIAD